MNTQKQIGLMVALVFFLTAGCAAYSVIDLPVRAQDQTEYQYDGSIERGALLYANNCRTCHGIRGEGFVGPPLNGTIREQRGLDNWQDQDPLVLARNTALLTRTLYCGRAGTLMPAWLDTNGGALNVRQIEHLVKLMTQPADIEAEDGSFQSKGWIEAEEFAHNLNHHTSLVVGGDTLATLAKGYAVGIPDLLAANPDITDPDAFLDKGTRVNVPATAGHEAYVYEVKRDRENLRKINDGQFFGAMVLADLNGIPYEVNLRKATFTIGSNPDLSEAGLGLYPGVTLKLPPGTKYTVLAGDTVASIADRHDTTTGNILGLNNSLPNDTEAEIEIPEGETVEVELPASPVLIVQGDSLDDIRKTLGGVTTEQLAEAQVPPVQPDHVYAIGTTLIMPEGAYGSTPPDAINTGTACVEHAVTANTFQSIFGGGSDTGKPDAPAEVSNEVVIQATQETPGFDWKVVADGTAQEPNKGVVKVAAGATVVFENVVGLHTITINGTKEGEDIGPAPEFREVVFNEPGDYLITCDYHPDMLAWVFVE